MNLGAKLKTYQNAYPVQFAIKFHIHPIDQAYPILPVNLDENSCHRSPPHIITSPIHHLANFCNDKSPKPDIKILRKKIEMTWRLRENHIKFRWNWMMRLCLHGTHTLMNPLGQIAYSYWAKQRALYSTLLFTFIFHVLQDNLKLWINNKRTTSVCERRAEGRDLESGERT